MGETIRLGDLCSVITKGTTPNAKLGGFSENGVSYIKSESLNYDGYVDRSKFVFVSEETNEKLKRSQLRNKDVLLSIAGANLGKCGIVKKDMLPANTNQAVAVIRVDPSKASPKFIHYFLRNPRMVEANLAGVAQSAQPNLNLGDISNFRLPALRVEEQRAIAALLSALDDKIELNRRMNETLEGLARALFRDWFVTFGPTRAKMEGRAPYLVPEIWSLFPDRLDDDSKPEGWEGKPLDEIADFLNGLALQKFPASEGDEYLPVIKIAELRNGISAKTNKASREVPEKYIIGDGDFVFSWSGSLMAKFWTGGEGALNQHLFKVSSQNYPAWFYSQWVFHHLAEFQGIAKSKATTMGHIQRGHLKAAMTICPPQDVLESLGTVLEPLTIKAIKNELESRTLAQTRDLLLPKLMSGEIRVREAEEIVEAAQ